MTKIAAVKAPSTAQQNSIHFILQGKGGVGKSLISSILAQYFKQGDGQCICYDTDPNNQTLVNYKALKAMPLELMEGSKIDERNFDNLMEHLLNEDGVFVIDNGASTFIPLANYLIENQALEMLRDAGRNVFIHTVITGGQALEDTLSGFVNLAEQANTNNIVVWLNEYFGSIQTKNEGGMPVHFTEMKAYQNNKDRVRGIVRIAKRNQDTFGKDMEEVVKRKLIFKEAIEGSDFTLMAKQRIKTIQRDIFSQLDSIGF